MQFDVYSRKLGVRVAIMTAPDEASALANARNYFALFDGWEPEDAAVREPIKPDPSPCIDRYGWAWTDSTTGEPIPLY